MIKSHTMDDAPRDRPVLLWARPYSFPYCDDEGYQWVTAHWIDDLDREWDNVSNWLMVNNGVYSAYANEPLAWMELPPPSEAAP